MIRRGRVRCFLCASLQYFFLCYAAPASSAWYLMWADEFDGPDVDETKWRIENDACAYGPRGH